MRPSEVAGLQVADLTLPPDGCGTTRLRGAITSPGTRYTDTAGTRDSKGLKHRPTGAVRSVPLPPDVVATLRAHLERWPAVDGLVFPNANGRSVTAENYGKVWNRTKAELWPAGHHLAGTTPYDLRHAAATSMLRAGVAPSEVARRLGHSRDTGINTHKHVHRAASGGAVNLALTTGLSRQHQP